MTEVGLYLGKFAPFHRGHQHLLETALSEVDELIVLVYPTDAIDVPLSVRAGWIRELYPEVTVLPAWTGPRGTGYGEAQKRRHEHYIIDRLARVGSLDVADFDPRDVDRFYSSEPYGEHVSAALDAEDRRVDPDREAVPISGTAIRQDPYGNREYVHPTVYRDLVTTVAVLGGPSTGKTTLVEALADHYDTAHVHEYGREFWEANHDADGMLSPEDLLTIARRHRALEDDRLTDADEYLFVDTNAIYTRAYARFYHDDVPAALEDLALACRDRYDVTILCDTDIPFADTPDRRDERSRRRLQAITRDFLDRYAIPYDVVSGSVSERVATVEGILADYDRYDAERSV